MKDWPADRVERRAIGGLVPFAQNARTHSAAQIAQIAASMREWGWTMPILVDEAGMIIAGHARVLAAQQLGFIEAPVMEARGWTDAQKRAYVLADNRISLNSGWDDELLALELSALNENGFDLALTGFDVPELNHFLQNDDDQERAEGTPEPPVNPVSVLGDVWILGKHRLLCGDSTIATDVDKVLDGVKPHLMVTDPPYGVSYDATWRKEALPDTNPGKTGGMHGKVSNDDNADWSAAWSLFPGDVAYVWHAGNKAHIVADSLLETGFDIRAQIIWAKHQFVIGRGNYHPGHEPCWYAVKQKANGKWQGDRTQSTLWKIDKPLNSETGHSTQKPIECMRRPICNNSSPGQAVYEPFSGSGTTIMAAELTGRICYAIELNPAYVDVAVMRWQEFTGQQAVHEDTSRTFEEMKGDRFDPDKNSADCYNVAITALREKHLAKQASSGKRHKADTR
jgi:DNA modification methylase